MLSVRRSTASLLVKQKSRSVAHLQPAQPIDVVGWPNRMTETYFVFYFDIISGGEKCLMSIAMRSATCSFSVQALPFPFFTLHISGARAGNEFSGSATKFRHTAITSAACGLPRSG